MNKSLFALSIAAILASTATASTVTIPNQFKSGTKAVAAQVNANFTAMKTAVDDNNARITTNEQAIAALQGSGSTGCPSDMVAVGSLCVDKFEASLWDAATGGTQIPASTCQPDGSDCAATAANPIYAQSVSGVNPAVSVSWFQAGQACANVGKRLPTTSEWVMAAMGTPSTPGDCNTTGGTIGLTGALAATCVSSAGAIDMVGNVNEWSADLSFTTADTETSLLTAAAIASSHGSDAKGTGSGTPSIYSVFTLTNGPSARNPVVGFRCVR